MNNNYISIFMTMFLISCDGNVNTDKRPSWDEFGMKITDGCSVPQFAVKVDFTGTVEDVNTKVFHCCYDHDAAYFEGEQPEYEKRKKADEVLKMCMQEELKKHEPYQSQAEFIADLYYKGVRIGGCSERKQPYRWGFKEDWVLENGKAVNKPRYTKSEVKLGGAKICKP